MENGWGCQGRSHLGRNEDNLDQAGYGTGNREVDGFGDRMTSWWLAQNRRLGMVRGAPRFSAWWLTIDGGRGHDLLHSSLSLQIFISMDYGDRPQGCDRSKKGISSLGALTVEKGVQMFENNLSNVKLLLQQSSERGAHSVHTPFPH